MKHAVPQDFIKSLHETIAWCRPRVSISVPKHCLRSGQLRPDYDFDSKPRYEVDLWADVEMINRVVELRSQFVTRTTLLLTDREVDLAGGRLLIHFLGESNSNGATAEITSFYLDNNDTPPWDTWVQAFIPESLPLLSPDSVPTEFRSLISWVPPQFLETVNEATEAECVGMLMWADAPRRWDGPVNYADSIPGWLEQLS
jgi:hypothetical protein